MQMLGIFSFAQQTALICTGEITVWANRKIKIIPLLSLRSYWYACFSVSAFLPRNVSFLLLPGNGRHHIQQDDYPCPLLLFLSIYPIAPSPIILFLPICTLHREQHSLYIH